ncbi:MAG: hypothetical protein HXY24_12610 [Rubrivivax sp.]|nr:hypothetical protein [Rubrivivax sp.]
MQKKPMKNCCLILIVFLLTCTPLWAGSTKYVSVFRSPRAGLTGLLGKKVAAFVVIPAEEIREAREETLAAEMRARGIDCIAGHLILPGPLVRDREKAKAFLKKAGVSGVVMLRLVGDEERTSHSPGTAWYSQPYYQGFHSYWGYGWSAVYIPEYTWTDRVIVLETLIYSIEEDALVWAGRSESTNPKDIQKFVKELVKEAGKELRKAGLVPK